MKSIRIRNLRCFKDTGKIELKPLTIAVGKNSCGKSTLLRTFPLFKQTLETKLSEPILWYGRYVDFGEFKESVSFLSDGDKDIEFEFEFLAQLEFLTGGRRYIQDNESVDRELLPARVALYICRDAVRKVTISVLNIDIELLYGDSDDSDRVTVKVNGQNCSDVDWRENPDTGGIIPNVFSSLDLMPMGPNYLFFRPLQEPKKPQMKNNPLTHLLDNLLAETSVEKNSLYYQLIYSSLIEDGVDFESKYATIRNSLKRAQSDDFLYHVARTSGQEKISKLSKAERDKIIKILKANQDKIKLYVIMVYIPRIIEYCNTYLNMYFRNVQYIAPVRATAERYYRKQGLDLLEVDARGENVSAILQHMKGAEIEQFNIWLNEKFGFYLSTQSTEGHVSIYIQNEKVKTNIADAGFGYSQILPILLLLWKNRNTGEKETREIQIVIEQPELHLHPKMQFQLLKLIVMMISENSGIKFLLETHSEVLINSLGELIADGSIDRSKVNVLLVEQSGQGESTIRSIDFSEEGYLLKWPLGFFQGGN